MGVHPHPCLRSLGARSTSVVAAELEKMDEFAVNFGDRLDLIGSWVGYKQ